MKYNLTEANKSDRDIIYLIKKDSIYKYVDAIWGWDEEYQMNDFNRFFIPNNFSKILVNENCVGFIEVYESDEAINITEIHIIPEYQGLGIGSSIITDIIQRAKRNNKNITLGCFKDNIGAVNLYKRLGFKMIKETDTHYCYKI